MLIGGLVMSSNKPEEIGDAARADEPADKARRSALRRMARFGAYTAPAMLVMLASEKAVHADSAR